MAQSLLDMIADPEAAAFAKPVGKDKRRKPKNIDVMNAILAGIGDLAYDVAGAPVDLSSGLMQALGFDVGQTAMGSDWLKSKATSAGIRPPVSSDPTLRDVRLGAEMASGGIDPMAVAGGIGRTGSAIAREAAPYIGNKLEDYMSASGLAPAVYLPPAPKKNKVGTRFTTEDQGGLVDKVALDIEKKMGATILPAPWDNSSRNVKITSVSDEPLDVPTITHGGQKYPRDGKHVQENIAGASAPQIVDRIIDRVAEARTENLAAGGTGEILGTANTMAKYSENYSVQPTQILLDNFVPRHLTPSKAREIDAAMRTQYPKFAGIATPEGQAQLMSTTGGQMRKHFLANIMYKPENQKFFGFNKSDISNALTDADLMDVPRGYGLNTVWSHGDSPVIATPSTNATYPTNFSGQYVGGMGNVPTEVYAPDAMERMLRIAKMSGKAGAEETPSLISMLEKRKKNVGQIVTPEVADRVKTYIELRDNMGLLPALEEFNKRFDKTKPRVGASGIKKAKK